MKKQKKAKIAKKTTPINHSIYHVLIVDCSGSMLSCRDATISGFNENLKSIKDSKVAKGINQYICLTTFDNSVKFNIWNKEISEATPLTTESYTPNGSTALYDGIGFTVDKLQKEIGDKIKSQDANVIVTIFTDGGENASTTWRFDKINALMTELRNSRMFTFTFIGCDEATLATAKSLGFTQQNTMSYAAGAVGTRSAFANLSKSRSAYVASVSNTVSTLKSVNPQAYGASLCALQDNFFDANNPNLSTTSNASAPAMPTGLTNPAKGVLNPVKKAKKHKVKKR